MPKLTLLSIVNQYLDSTDGFRVASIDDTIESQQIASIAEKVFYDLNDDVFTANVTQELVQLESASDNTKPNYLRLPDNAVRVVESKVMYDISDDITEIEMIEIDYIPPVDFLDLLGNTNANDNTEIITDFSGYRFNIRNNKMPEFYTDFDDEFLVFDSFDKAVDSVLQKSKSGILVTTSRSFTTSDTYIIDFPEWFHTIYQNAVIAEAAELLREEPLPSIARKARIGIIKSKKRQRDGTPNRTRRNYGRNSR